jgi:hypothetical protein
MHTYVTVISTGSFPLADMVADESCRAINERRRREKIGEDEEAEHMQQLGIDSSCNFRN